ncbi:MAG TPA: TIGR03809 family protein [Xanthobacteraceae bacterium]|jgi:uncharacterized repeat protein (TIGR03809 family)|nr:TIGR03809 family protein [Xanthobacteraceae bacterium]
MSERQTSPYDSVARKWLALVERRQEHFVELCNTGRWRHYYTRAEFLEEMRKVLRVRDQWASIAGLPVSDEALHDEMLGDDLFVDEEGEPLQKPLAPSHFAPSNGFPSASWPD